MSHREKSPSELCTHGSGTHTSWPAQHMKLKLWGAASPPSLTTAASREGNACQQWEKGRSLSAVSSRKLLPDFLWHRWVWPPAGGTALWVRAAKSGRKHVSAKHTRKEDGGICLIVHTHKHTKVGKRLYWIPPTQEFVSHSGRFMLLWYNFSGSVCLQLWGSPDSGHISVYWPLSNQ